MSRYLVPIVIVLSVFAVGPSAVKAQTDPNGPMQLRLYAQVRQGQLDAWIEARQEMLEHRREHEYRWNERVTISEDNVIRTTILLPNGISDWVARQEWLASTPRANTGLGSLTSRFWNELSRPRPELSHNPENRRVAQGEVGFIQERRIYSSPGNGNALAEFMEQVAAAFAAAGSDQPRFVSSGVLGGSPHLSIFYPAEDAVDYYGVRESLQPIFAGLRSQRTPGAVQRTEIRNWTRRRDLDFSLND